VSLTVIAERIDELVGVHGGLNQTAVVLGIDKGYLSRLRTGAKSNPSGEVLKKLGLYRTVEYRRIPTLQLRTKSA
jgi:transcriptional regulator with XRE-family HTH domain